MRFACADIKQVGITSLEQHICGQIPTLRPKGVCLSTFEQTSHIRIISICS